MCLWYLWYEVSPAQTTRQCVVFSNKFYHNLPTAFNLLIDILHKVFFVHIVHSAHYNVQWATICH